MQTKDFLFEIGAEEIPAGYISAAVNKLESYFASKLKEAKLSYENISTFSTPRRLAIKVINLQTKQEDEIIEKIGPAKNIAYDENGNLTKAGLGFLNGVDEKKIYFQQTKKGEKIALKIQKQGKDTKLILSEFIKDVIKEIPFPKKMKWNQQQFSFARPIRWLLAIYGNEVIPAEFNGNNTGNISFGNRFQKLENPVKINSADEYEEKLKSVFVIVNRDERKKMIVDQIHLLFENSSKNILEDKNLLETVTDLVEFPTAIIAEFDEKYLNLPKAVITSTLSEHQKYFPVINKEKELINKFVFISNGNPENSELIKLGNEKVITARLEDAAFYYNEDKKQPLESYVPKLKEVTFQSGLGTIFEKTERLTKIVEFLNENLRLSETEKKNSLRAAYLCKADLVTLMINEKEYTKLQGYMGYNYALESGESRETAQAILTHYQGGNAKDEYPMSKVGALVAITDKMDTVCGIFGVGLIPTGSKDPFALRRATNGIVQIIDSQKFEINLHQLIDKTFEILKDKLEKPGNNKNLVYDFFKQRINWFLKQTGIDYDVIESVMHIDHSNITDLKQRASDLQKFKQREDFIKLVIGFKRVSNIIAEAKNLGTVNIQLLHENTEKILYKKYLTLSDSLEKSLQKKNYENIMENLVSFSILIDNFFDDVLVNVPDEELRQNRYNLLGKIRKLFLHVADIAKIVVEEQK
ncbi:MAG: glycine--tRNA ligase subunit beta [Armatimonadetes bacterium]|nr:glycine--tRNA ligase subunit beta [Armatimonadota bacterium]